MSGPDPRFSLANERTLLAYQRTAIGLLAAAIAVAQFFGSSLTVAVLSVGLVVAALVAGIGGYLRFQAVERAIRKGSDAPASYVAPLMSMITVLCVVAAAAYVVTRL
ncbi:MAG: YidH family protein [Marmoricola sp.]